jgi:glycine oxidase
MAAVKSWDVIIVGGGIIGLSLSVELHKQGASVLIVEKGEPGREASRAAGGMLVGAGEEIPAALQKLASASARMYPEFVHELQDESGVDVDLRSNGTLLFPDEGQQSGELHAARTPLPMPIHELEPALAVSGRTALFVDERSVCPRNLTEAAIKAARHRGIDLVSGAAVVAVDLSGGRVAGVSTSKTSYHAPKVVNCAGAWAGQISPLALPTRPVKGQMVCLAMPSRNLLQHVVRSPEIYLIPRSDGRLLAGATVEEAGFDKRTVPETILRLHNAAIALLPALQDARVLEAWAGLRPGTADGLPILGRTSIPGYYVATGHFRDGILLAPITAQIIAQTVQDLKPAYDLSAFSPERFAE